MASVLILDCFVISSTSQPDIFDKLEIAPNPASSGVWIRQQSSFALTSVKLMDALGRQVFATDILNKHAYYLDVSHFISGIYYLEIGANQQVKRQKLIIAR
ncbi:MAG: T9SS type A sorting domain-containing protein [Saprospiraceae bacterium]|nr:T9SS type A sorting domain-containing protein [Saprospiraceae bacterium]